MGPSGGGGRGSDQAGVQRALERLHALNPADPVVKNNLAMVSLLLNLKTAAAHRLAQELYQQFPTNSSVASTYAFSLFRQQKIPQARQTLEQLGEPALAKPSIAAA